MTPEDKKLAETLKIEKQISARFFALVALKVYLQDIHKKLDDLDSFYKRPQLAAEKRILNEMKLISLSKGMISGLACFAFLRTSPRLISNYLRRPPIPFTSDSGYKFDSLKKNQNVERAELVFRGARLLFDSFVSLSIGACASFIFTDKDKAMEQFTTVPLVEGFSLVSEGFCKDFTKEFQQYDRKVWNSKHPSLTGGDVSIGQNDYRYRDMIQGFVVNCKRREIYEKKVREEQGLKKRYIVIPSPGVPRDIPVTLDDLLPAKKSCDNTQDAKG